NSNNWAAVGPKAGPETLFDRENTKMCPFEFTATPGTSPKFMPSGSLKKSGTESKDISGALCCANDGTANNRTDNANRQRFIQPPEIGLTRMAVLSPLDELGVP